MNDMQTGLVLLVLLAVLVYVALRLLARLVLGKQTRGDRAWNRHVTRQLRGKLKPGEAEAFRQKWEWRDDHVERRARE